MRRLVAEQRQRPGDEGDAASAERPIDLEGTVDELEERILGHRMDQVRSEDDDPAAPAFEQDLDDEPPADGPAAEPS
jgi:hypothetical protein